MFTITACGNSDNFAPPAGPATLGVPTITALNSAYGPSTGGTVVTITGTDLTGATEVKFGTKAATAISVTSNTEMTATAPAGTAGTVDVTVTTPGGTSVATTTARYGYTINTQTGTWPAGQVKTLTTNITGPANAQQTSFTGNSGPWNYVLYKFTVPVSGTYTATSTTTTVTNTTWFVTGIFIPNNTALGNPFTDFIVAVLATGAAPGSGSFTGVALVTGQQYSVLVAFNTGSTAGDLSTLTITGPGGVGVIPTP